MKAGDGRKILWVLGQLAGTAITFIGVFGALPLLCLLFE